MILPRRNGLAASTVQLPQGDWATVLECLCARFPTVSAVDWASRMQRGLVVDAQGRALPPQQPYRAEQRIHYYREVPDEPRIPFVETVLSLDANLLVVDKPHFLPVTPSGGYVQETLLARLARRYPILDLVPLHRIDRGTAGLVLFSVNPATRARYQALFRERAIVKRYEAIAAPLPLCEFPLVRRSRLVAGAPFVRMQETPGVPNSETRIEVIARDTEHWHYALFPVSGKKHQLRVHMAQLGAPIRNDDFYPEMTAATPGNYDRPLQLLAQALAFVDPCDGTPRHFYSGLRLLPIAGLPRNETPA